MSLHQLPQGERLLSGKLTASLNDSDTTAYLSNPPSADKLPTYIEIDPDNSSAETVRVVAVGGGGQVTIERGVYNGGVGKAHNNNATYKQKITAKHWDALVDALEAGYLTLDSSLTITRNSDTQFTISNQDYTNIFTKNRVIRINENNSYIYLVDSSTLSGSNTVVNIRTDKSETLPATISTVEFGIQPVKSTEKLLTTNDLLDEDDMASNSDTAVSTQQSVVSFVGDSTGTLYRNAIINGNFDIWQRGTSFTSSGYWADRWRGEVGGGATISRQSFTVGQTDVPNNPKYYLRHDRTTAASADNTVLEQRIEGVRTFAGKTITVAFYAKAGAAKTLKADVLQNFGSGGSASSDVTVTAQDVALTTSWQRFTLTFSVPSISGKTLDGDDDYLAIRIREVSSYGTFTVDFAQFQVNAGSIALPFQPRSYADELRLCQRYYVKITGSLYVGLAFGWAFSTTQSGMALPLPVVMRTSSASGGYSALSDFQLICNGSSNTVTSISFTDLNFDIPGSSMKGMYVRTASGLTSNHPVTMKTGNSGYLYVDAEL